MGMGIKVGDSIERKTEYNNYYWLAEKIKIMSDKEGPIFYLQHVLSGKYIHPVSGAQQLVTDGDKLHLWDGKPSYCRFQFIPEKKYGQHGYIKHVESGKYIRPYKIPPRIGEHIGIGISHSIIIKPPSYDPITPENGSGLCLVGGTNVAILFSFDLENNVIRHRQGLYVHPQSGDNWPDNGTVVHMYNGIIDGAKFNCVDDQGNQVTPYNTPTLGGYWKRIFSVIDPKAEHTTEYEYKEGKSQSLSTTKGSTWEVSAQVAIGWFTASASYSSRSETTSANTWTTETTRRQSVKVLPGKTVVVWQYVFTAELDGDQLSFQSSLFQDTDDYNKKPEDLETGEIQN